MGTRQTLNWRTWRLFALAAGGLWMTLAAVVVVKGADADLDNPFATSDEKAAATEVRTWNDKSGTHKIEAKLLKVDQGNVVLKRTDGKEVTVPLEKLCDDDQKFVAKISGTKVESAPAPSQRSLADDATGDKPSDVVSQNLPNGVPAVTMLRTDYRKAKPIDLLESDAWTYAPDASNESQKLPAVRVPLKAMDFSDRPTGILLLPGESKAFVVYYNVFKQRSVVQSCNLQTKQVDARAVFAEDEAPLDVSPDGALVLSQGQKWGDPTSKSILLLYHREGNAVKPIKEWRPFSTGEDAKSESDTEVKWAQFADSKHLLTSSTFGKLVCWEVPELRAVWETKIGFGNEPVFSAGRKYVAFASTAESTSAGDSFGTSLVASKNKNQATGYISILNVADGAVAASIPLEDSGMCSMAMRDDGKRLAIWQTGAFAPGIWKARNWCETSYFRETSCLGSDRWRGRRITIYCSTAPCSWMWNAEFRFGITTGCAKSAWCAAERCGFWTMLGIMTPKCWPRQRCRTKKRWRRLPI